MAQWPAFDVSGTFSVRRNYEITNGARKSLILDDMSLDIDKDNTFPRDPQALVGVIANAIPKEMSDPNEDGMDTTYMDLELCIVRLTVPKFKGTRIVFIRKGCVQFWYHFQLRFTHSSYSKVAMSGTQRNATLQIIFSSRSIVIIRNIILSRFGRQKI